ncbi:MAG: DivIVA domain-containing protein, partial [Balneolaceae bacterium]
KLTALEIKQQSFEKSLRGYDTGEVQAFLNLVASEWEHMTARIRELEEQVQKMNDKLKHYERVEEALHETLQTAKDSAKHKMEDAKKDARILLEKAEAEADSIVREASHQRQQIRQSIHRLLDKREEMMNGMSTYLEHARDTLEQFSRDDASIFELSEDEPAGSASMTVEKKSSHSAKKEQESDDDSTSAPGEADMDEILDDID